MEVLGGDNKEGDGHHFGDDLANLYVKVPDLPLGDKVWKENEESNTVRPKVLIDLQTDRLGDLASQQERRHSYSHSKVQFKQSMSTVMHTWLDCVPPLMLCW